MDWQVIILTLGASLITGIITLLGNIIVSKSNIKSITVENEYKDKKEFIDKRIKSYDDILNCINHEFNNLTKEEKKSEEQKKNIDKIWRCNFHYCSKAVNKRMVLLIKYFDTSYRTKQRISVLSEVMKKDIDRYYGIKDKDYKKVR